MKTVCHRQALTLLLSLALLCAAALPAFAAEPETAGEILSARTSAMGGTHVGLADDLDTLFANPAGFRSAAPEVTYLRLALDLSGPLFDLAGIVAEGMAGTPAEDLLARSDVKELMKSLYTAAHLLGPVSFGYVGNGWGLGMFNRTGFSAETRGTVPTVTASFEEELTLAGGYSFRLPLPDSLDATLDLGLMLKTFVRSRFTTTQDLLGFLSMSDPSSFLASEPFRLTVGVGADLGLLYTWHRWFSAGLVVQEHPAGALVFDYPSLQGFLDGADAVRSTEMLPVNVTAGITVRAPLGAASRYLRDLSISLDYHDLLEFLSRPEDAANPILHVGLGAEVVLLEILALRAGFYQGLLSAGLGLDLHGVELDLAVFGRELSTEPGLRPVFNLLLGMQIRHEVKGKRGRG